MEVGLSLYSTVSLPLSSNSKTTTLQDAFLKPHSDSTKTHQKRKLLEVEAKGKRGMQARRFQRAPPHPSLPKIEDEGNPKFVVFIRTNITAVLQNIASYEEEEAFLRLISSPLALVYLWYPLSLITGGTTAKIMVAAKDNFLGKYMYKDTISRNLAAVIYRV
ncbi:hypothetical protein MRB53_016228 [Persea americana]|uniref:Uncharacterized protein n=1 Tax=Persea americana TaxID=3435 RepID=A0ACC2M1F5_PERAE|nr:hypothetical protein MRB53_016228 [Persea americana]